MNFAPKQGQNFFEKFSENPLTNKSISYIMYIQNIYIINRG